MKTHDHMKPFQCSVCNRGYNTAAALTSHMQNHKRNNHNSSSTNSHHHPLMLTTGTTNGTSSPHLLNHHKSVLGSKMRESPKRSNHLSPSVSPASTSPQSSNHPKSNNHHNNHHSPRSSSPASPSPKSLQQNSSTSPSSLSVESIIKSSPPSKVSSNHNRSPSPKSPKLHQNLRRTPVSSSKSLQHNSSTSPLSLSIERIIKASPSSKVSSNHNRSPSPRGIPVLDTRYRYETSTRPASPRLPHQIQRRTPVPSSIPLLCNNCSPSPTFPDFESFRLHMQAHLSHAFCPICLLYKHHSCIPSFSPHFSLYNTWEDKKVMGTAERRKGEIEQNKIKAQNQSCFRSMWRQNSVSEWLFSLFILSLTVNTFIDSQHKHHYST